MHNSGTNFCSKCGDPLTFQPRVKVNDLDGLSMSDPLGIRELIHLSEEDLDDYDAEITRLQSQLIHAQTQRKRLNDFKTQLHSFLSSLSFQKFPNEILCTIFESVCTNNLLQQYPWLLDPEREPTTKLSSPAIAYLPSLSISAVCTRWRSLTLSLPRLWSQLRLETACEETTPDGFISTLKLYLDRSANSPLIIDLETQGEVRINSALDLVLDHASRWQTFSYTGDYVLSRCIGNERKKEVFPILEDLNLEGYRYNIERSDLACFEHAPRLRAVRTDFFKRSCSELPWTQLTSLDVGVYEAEDIYLLQQCPSLTVLKLRNYQWSTLGPISSASLESFTFVCPKERREEHLLENVFCCFTFPSLAKLVIYSEDSSTTNLIWPLDAFSAFISRSSCALTTLSLSSVVISDVNLIAALRLVPSLTNLFLDGLEDPEGRSPLTSHFISSMQGSSPTHLVPKLCSLSIKFKGTSFDDVAFINMVSSRWTPDRTHAAAIGIDCLRSLVLHFLDREVDEDVYRPLWHLDEMGMRVVITSKK